MNKIVINILVTVQTLFSFTHYQFLVDELLSINQMLIDKEAVNTLNMFKYKYHKIP